MLMMLTCTMSLWTVVLASRDQRLATLCALHWAALAVGVRVPFGVLASVPPIGKGRFAFEFDLLGGLLFPFSGEATFGGGGMSVLSTRVVFFLGLGAMRVSYQHHLASSPFWFSLM